MINEKLEDIELDEVTDGMGIVKVPYTFENPFEILVTLPR